MDDMRAPYHLMLQHLLAQGGESVLENALYDGVRRATGLDLDEILCGDQLPPGCAEYLAEWLFLIERLVDTSRILDSRYALPTKYEPDQHHVPFRSGRYLVTVHHIAFRAVKKLWGKNALKGYTPKPNAPKLLETLLAVLRHIIKSEEHIQKQVDKENREDEDHPNRLTDALNKRWAASTPKIYDPFSEVDTEPPESSSLSALYQQANRDQQRRELSRLLSRAGGDLEAIRSESMDVRLLTAQLGQQLDQGSRAVGEGGANETYSNALQLLMNEPGAPQSSARVSSSTTSATQPASDTPTQEQNDNMEVLVGMGYSRRLAIRALEHSRNSISQAVEFCINNNRTAEEDDELEMAIQMSLEPNDEEGETPPAQQENEQEKETAEREKAEREEAERIAKETIEKENIEKAKALQAQAWVLIDSFILCVRVVLTS